MNISIYSQTQYSPYMPDRFCMQSQSAGSIMGRKHTPSGSQTQGFMKYGQEVSYDKPSMSQELRQLIRELKQTPQQNQNPYAVTSDSKTNGFLDLSGSPDSDEEELEKPIHYNYKEVASKIQQAKTSVSAGRAVLSASRKVQEIKRKISAHEGDAEELQLALTHAKRMEMVARKKKHHLELEEMAAHTGKRDENRDKMEEAAADMKDALIFDQENKVADEEDAIFDEREKMIHEAAEQLSESREQVSEDMLADLNERIAEFGEEELEELEETMEMLENMEIVDPHMSKEDLENLKRKHRAAENRDIVKADMDYLKDMIRHQLDKGGGIPGMNAAGANFSYAVPSLSVTPNVSIPAAPVSADVSIDIQV